MPGSRQAGPPDTAQPAAAAPAPARAGTAASEDTRGPLVLAVDGTGLLVRCSRVRGHLQTGGGVPTGTLTLFAGSLSRKIRLLQPGYLLVAWDGPGSRDWRRQLYPGYKMSRPLPPPLVGSEMRQVTEFCRAAGIRQLSVPGFEADDLLAAVTRSVPGELPDGMLWLCSDDQDLLQLLSDQAVLTGLTTDAPVTAGDVCRTWEVDDPKFLPHVRALAGDPSDGIPGIRGIGRKRAARMLAAASWQWESIPAAHREAAGAWLQVMDLNNSPYRPEDTGDLGTGYFSVTHAKWDPRRSADSSELQELLSKYELSVLARRLKNGRLW